MTKSIYRRFLVKMLFLSFFGFIIFTFGIVSISMAWPKTAKTQKEMLADARNSLENTMWKIELTEISTKTGKKMEGEPDTLRFEANKISSEKMSSEGFSSTGYTVRLKGKDNEIVVWETMQTSEKEGIAFWRGQIVNEAMRGVLSWHIDEGKKRDYTFTSVAKEGISLPVEEEPVVEEEKEAPVEVKEEILPVVQEEELEKEKAVEVKESKKEEAKEDNKGWWFR